MSDIEARRLVIRVDYEGNANKELIKTSASTKKLMSSSNTAKKEMDRINKTQGKFLNSAKKTIDDITQGFPLLNKSIKLASSGLEAMVKGLKSYFTTLKQVQKTSSVPLVYQQNAKPSYPSVFNTPHGNGSASSSGGEEDAGEEVNKAVSKIPWIGPIISAGIDLAKAADKAATQGEEMLENQRKTEDRLMFQLPNLGRLPEEVAKVSSKWSVKKADLYEASVVGAQNLLSSSTIKKVLDGVAGNARALGMGAGDVMGAYGRTASTGSSDFLDINRSALINAGYGKDVRGYQTKLNAYQQLLSANGNDPMLQQKLMPQIEKINDSILSKVGKKATTTNLPVYQKELSEFKADNLKINASHLYLTVLGIEGSNAQTGGVDKGKAKNNTTIIKENGRVMRQVMADSMDGYWGK